MLLTTNKIWNCFITLHPAAREDVIVALVTLRRAGVVARVVIIVVIVVVLSGVVNVLVRRKCPHCCRRYR